MSEDTNTSAVITPMPKATPKAKRVTTKEVPFSSLHVAYGNVRGCDVTRAAKLNRSYIRSNFDAIAKQWPALRTSQKQNRDSNRYPDRIPAKVADMIVKRSIPGAKK